MVLPKRSSVDEFNGSRLPFLLNELEPYLVTDPLPAESQDVVCLHCFFFIHRVFLLADWILPTSPIHSVCS